MPRSPAGAGALIDLIAFDERTAVDDGYGNTVSGPFVEQFQQRGGFIMLRGGEGIEAARLEGRQPAILRTRNSPQAQRITTDWQARDVRKGTLFNIETVTTDNTREWLEMLVQSGVATG